MKTIRFALWPTVAGVAGYFLGGPSAGAVAAIGMALIEDARRRFGTSK